MLGKIPYGPSVNAVFGHEVFKRSVARTLDNIGFDASTAEVLDVLSVLCRRYFETLCRRVGSYRDNAGRCKTLLHDVERAFDDQGVNLNELVAFVQQVGDLPKLDQIPNYPVVPAWDVDSGSKSKKGNVYSNASLGQVTSVTCDGVNRESEKIPRGDRRKRTGTNVWQKSCQAKSLSESRSCKENMNVNSTLSECTVDKLERLLVELDNTRESVVTSSYPENSVLQDLNEAPLVVPKVPKLRIKIGGVDTCTMVEEPSGVQECKSPEVESRKKKRKKEKKGKRKHAGDEDACTEDRRTSSSGKKKKKRHRRSFDDYPIICDPNQVLCSELDGLKLRITIAKPKPSTSVITPTTTQQDMNKKTTSQYDLNSLESW